MLGCDAVASGHYVRIRHSADGSALLRGRDPDKDQSYFLWGLPPDMLPLLEFPVGDLTKSQVRARARELGLATADKPESQEICFVPTGHYRDFLERRLPVAHASLQPGDLVDRAGNVVGQHTGYAGFTVGQRKGLGGGFPEAFYVLEIRPDLRQVVVGPLDELYSHAVRVADLNWLGPRPGPGHHVSVQIRYRAAAVPARVIESERVLTLAFEHPQKAVTPGQSAVLFQDERVLGGGRIREAVTPALV